MPARTLLSGHLPPEDPPRGPIQKADSHQDFPPGLGEEREDGVEDILLLLRDDAGGWILLEGAVPLLLGHLKREILCQSGPPENGS